MLWSSWKTLEMIQNCGYCRKGFWRNEYLKTYIMKHQGYLNDNLSSVLLKFHHFYKLLKLCTGVDGTFIFMPFCGEWAKWLASYMLEFVIPVRWNVFLDMTSPKNASIWIQLNILNIYSFGRDWLVLDQIWVFWTLIYYV